MASRHTHVSHFPSRPSTMHRAVRGALLSLVVAAPVHFAFAVDAEQQVKNEAVLPAVTATAERTATTEGSKSYRVKATSSSTGLTLSPRDTPQSVSVVTRQQMDDMNIQNLDQLLNVTTGVTTTQLDLGSRMTFTARGFTISTFRVDGIEISGASGFSGYGGSINTDLYDHVEVVRGANGLMGGTGDPSATINLMRKKPKANRSISAGVTYGSWNNKHVDVDVNLPVTEDGRVRSRFVVSSNDGGTFRDREHISNLGFLGVVEADLTTDTTVSIGVQHEKTRNDGASWGPGVPVWFADGTRANMPRSFNPVANWSYTERDSTTVFANFEQRLANRWKANLAASYSKGEAINNLGVIKANSGTAGTYVGFLNPDGTGGILNGYHAESETEMAGLSASLSGPFELLGREHELMFGLNGSQSKVTSYTFNAINCSLAGVGRAGCQIRSGLPIANTFTWDGNYYNFVTYRTNARGEAHVDNVGLYTAARLNVTDSFKAIVGARLSRYKTYTDTFSVANVGTRNQVMSKEVVTPYAGLIYDISQQYSLYASYTDLFNPQSSRDRNGDYLKPITGSSYEAGIKGELLNGALNVSAAVFQAKQNNVAIADGDAVVPGTSTQAFTAGAIGVESKGIEFEANGNLTKNWTGMFGYTYTAVDNLNTAARDPKSVFRLQTSYRFSGDLNKLTIGGGASYQSGSIWNSNPVRPLVGGGYDTAPLKTNGYALFNAMARYQINENLVATLNISNLFDKTYYRQYGFYNGLIYGEPRRITVGLRASF